MCGPANRPHEGCGEKWNGGDVIGLRLGLDGELDAGALLEGLGEVALLAEGDYVVVEDPVALFVEDGDAEGGVVASVAGVRLLAGLLTVPKRVMVLRVCMLFLLVPGHSGHTARRVAKVRCSQVAAKPRCQAKKFLEWGPGRRLGWGRRPEPGGRRRRVLRAEPQGAATSTAAVTDVIVQQGDL